jgi:hypothetical protein
MAPGSPRLTVEAIVEAMYRRLCLRVRHQGAGAAMSLTELRIGLGVTEEQLAEAVKVARISDDLFVAFTAPDRLTLGPSWRGRCEDERHGSRSIPRDPEG